MMAQVKLRTFCSLKMLLMIHLIIFGTVLPEIFKAHNGFGGSSRYGKPVFVFDEHWYPCNFVCHCVGV